MTLFHCLTNILDAPLGSVNLNEITAGGALCPNPVIGGPMPTGSSFREFIPESTRTYVLFFKHVRDRTAIQANEAEENMFGADMFMVKAVGLLGGKTQRPSGVSAQCHIH